MCGTWTPCLEVALLLLSTAGVPALLLIATAVSEGRLFKRR